MGLDVHVMLVLPEYFNVSFTLRAASFEIEADFQNYIVGREILPFSKFQKLHI